MPNNKSIQILRTNIGEAVLGDNNKNKIVKDGQPIYDRNNNWLYIANNPWDDEQKKIKPEGTIENACIETIHPNYNE